MSKKFAIGFIGGIVAGVLLASGIVPHIATAQSASAEAVVGTYQLQIAAGVPQIGTSTVWRLNTATGALEFCQFLNVALPGNSHISCQGNPK